MYGNICSKRYKPAFIDLDNDNSSYSLVIKFAGENKKILEVGTSAGYLTKILKDMGNTITGIEVDPEAAHVARQYCDVMIVGDIETLDLDAYLRDSAFDVIIFGDVLEHLRSPGIALEKVKKYLGPGGYLVVSMPNVCHGDLLLNMLYGDFKYTAMGLLDETHLRFFAFRNIVELFNRSGYGLAEIKTTVFPVGQTELKVDMRIVPPRLLDFIRSLPDSSVYQFVFKAIPGQSQKNLNVPYAPLSQIFKEVVEVPMIRDEEERARTLMSRISELESMLCERDHRIAQMSQIAGEQNVQVSLLNGRLSDATAYINKLTNELESMKRSIVWQATRKLDDTIVDRLLPHGTWRRHAYGVAVESGQAIASKGLRGFLHGKGKDKIYLKGR